MNTSHISNGNDEVPLLDLTARVAFQSESSISFDIGRMGNSLRLPTGEGEEEVEFTHGRPWVFTVLGWIDVHHPCNGHIKTQLRIRIPAEYQVFDKMTSIIRAVFELLAIPSDETYEADFFSSDQINSIHQPTNREGVADRI